MDLPTKTSDPDGEAAFLGHTKKWQVAELVVAGSSQRDAARAVGVNESTVSNWKRHRDAEYMQYLRAHLLDVDEIDHEIQSLQASQDARVVLRRLARNEDNDADTKERIDAARTLLNDAAARRRVRVEITGAGGGAVQHSIMAEAILRAPDAEKPPKPEGWDETYGVQGVKVIDVDANVGPEAGSTESSDDPAPEDS
jgi:hypothetical protein